jgi:hypothetical protein
MRLTDESVPSEAQVTAARERLQASFRAEREWRPRYGPHRWRIGIAAGLALSAIGMMVVFFAPRSAEAALAELAQQTRQLKPEELPSGSFVYTRSDRLTIAGGKAGPEPDAPLLVYLLPSSVEAWWSEDTVYRKVTTEAPVFFDPDQERVYYAAGLDHADGVGQTRTETAGKIANQLDLASWDTDPEILRDQIDERLSESPSGLSHAAQVFQFVLRLLGPEVQAPPLLRAALLEVLNTVSPNVERVSNGNISVSVKYVHPVGDVTEIAIFDQTGYLAERILVANVLVPDLGAPSGTVIGRETLSAPVVVSAAGIRP